ncbi:phospholipase D family protein [Streptomyces specialis]|uniref:phospholipase D family protein n=1 Tax=Streptomyces specialis TaxID=498367 RepID=UPI00073F7ACD|nr:phospholipase D family protein [Streptomyces specialis]
MRPDHVWGQLHELLSSAHERVVLVAPFIKKEVFAAALAAIGDRDVELLCVTRWAVMEIAAGVTDPEIAELAEQDDRVTVRLCHDLHAKLYVADERCLVGSANLTGRATGRRLPKNLELLVEVPTGHPEVQSVLEQIQQTAIPADVEMARQLRSQANLLASAVDRSEFVVVVDEEADSKRARWRPETRVPLRLYPVYQGLKCDYPNEILAGVARDLAYLNIQPGLDEAAFSQAVRSRLYELPEVTALAVGGSLSLATLQRSIMEADGREEEAAKRAAENIAEWLSYFDEVQIVPTGPWEIRRGRELA